MPRNGNGFWERVALALIGVLVVIVAGVGQRATSIANDNKVELAARKSAVEAIPELQKKVNEIDTRTQVQEVMIRAIAEAVKAKPDAAAITAIRAAASPETP